jgi:hypothetical protein
MSLVFLILNNDGYEIKSIDKLHYIFLAGLSHNKWQKLNIEDDAAQASNHWSIANL